MWLPQVNFNASQAVVLTISPSLETTSLGSIVVEWVIPMILLGPLKPCRAKPPKW
jgi:hypothetical protein